MSHAEATLARKIGSAIVVVIFSVVLCWLIQWRSAPPPPRNPISAVPK